MAILKEQQCKGQVEVENLEKNTEGKSENWKTWNDDVTEAKGGEDYKMVWALTYVKCCQEVKSYEKQPEVFIVFGNMEVTGTFYKKFW